jgi:hypothetical protein
VRFEVLVAMLLFVCCGQLRPDDDSVKMCGNTGNFTQRQSVIFYKTGIFKELINLY